MVEYYIKLGQKRRAKRKVAANIQRLYRGIQGRKIADKIRRDRDDLLLAKKIQDEEDRMPRRSRKTTRSETADYELARKLQAEESGRKSSRLSAVAKESVENSDKPSLTNDTIETKQSTTSNRKSMPITPSPNKGEELDYMKKKAAVCEKDVKIQSKKREISMQLDDMDIKDELDSMPHHVRKAAEKHPGLVVKLISDKKKRRKEDDDMDISRKDGKKEVVNTEENEVISIGSSSEESEDETSLLQRKMSNAKGRGLGLMLR